MVSIKTVLSVVSLPAGFFAVAVACSTTAKGPVETPSDAAPEAYDRAPAVDGALPACGTICPRFDACPTALDEAFLEKACALEKDVYRSTIPCGPLCDCSV